MQALRPPLADVAALEAALGKFGRLDEILGALDHFSLIEFSCERRRFAMHRLVQAAGRALVEPDSAAWVDCAVALVRAALLEREDDVASINADLDNIRSVLRWAIDERKAVPGGADLLNRLSSFWQATGKHAEAHRWYETVLELSDAVPADLFTRLLLDAGAIELFRDEFDRAIELLELAIPRLSSPDMRLTRARALSTLGTAFYYRVSHDRAEELWRESLEILEAEEHHAGMARVIGNLGLIAWQVREEYDNGRAMFGRALELAAEVGIGPLEALYLGNLGEICFATGEVDRAVEFALRSLEMYRELGNELFVAEQLKLLGKYEIARNHGETARGLLRDALEKFVQLSQDIDVAECLTLIAQITDAVGESDTAAKLLAFSLQVFIRGQRSISKQDRARMQALHQDVTRALGERLAALEEDGRALSQTQAVRLAASVTRQQLE